MAFLHHLQPFGLHKTWQCNQSLSHFARILADSVSDKKILFDHRWHWSHLQSVFLQELPKKTWWIKCIFMMANLFWSQRGKKCRDWSPSKQVPRPMASCFEESSACHVAASGPVWLMFSSILWGWKWPIFVLFSLLHSGGCTFFNHFRRQR